MARSRILNVWCSRRCRQMCAAVFATCVAMAALAQSQSPAGSASSATAGVEPSGTTEFEPPVVPVHDEPHHRQLFQYGPTRILDLQLPPGDRSWFHSHEWPVLYLTLSSAPMRNQVPGGEWTGGARRNDAAQSAAPVPRPAPRPTSFAGYFERPSTHRIENAGDTLLRALVVINETPGNPELSIEQAGFAGEPEVDNAWFRAYRVMLASGEATRTHRHDTPVVILQATDGTGESTGPMRFEFNEPGQWSFYDTGTEHVIRNLGDAPIELIEVEVRVP